MLIPPRSENMSILLFSSLLWPAIAHEKWLPKLKPSEGSGEFRGASTRATLFQP